MEAKIPPRSTTTPKEGNAWCDNSPLEGCRGTRRGGFSISGFTLVELIVVITILTILGTIAFVQIGGFAGSARDGDRVTTLKNIDSGLAIFKLQSGIYPMPEAGGSTSSVLTGSINGTIYAYMGVIGDLNTRNIKLNKVPVDPLSGVSYVYGISNDQKYYQTATVLENTEAYQIPHLTSPYQGEGLLANPPSSQWEETCFSPPYQGGAGGGIIPTVYAVSSYQAKVNGTYPGYFKFSSGSEVWIANIPSLLWNNTGSVSLFSTGTYFVVNHQSNLPYKLDASTVIQNKDANQMVQAIVGTWVATLTGVNISGVTTSPGVTSLFSGSLLASFGGNVSTVQEVVLWSATASAGTVVPNNCTLSGTTVLHGVSVTAYSEHTIVWNAGYKCTAREQTRTCSDGTLSGSGSYQYSLCVKGTPNTCSASGSYVYNGHSYSIPALSHGSGAVNILSLNVSENNGTFQYTLSSVTCNDGVYASVSEGGATVQGCNGGYGVNGNVCSLSQSGTCNNAVALGCSVGSAINDNGLASCGTTRTWNCSGLYGGGNSVQCSLGNPSCSYFAWMGTSGSPWNKSDSFALKSCQEYNLQATTLNNGTTRWAWTCWDWTKTCLSDWVYYIAPDLNQVNKFAVYCDMTINWWGWNLVDNATNWNTFTNKTIWANTDINATIWTFLPWFFWSTLPQLMVKSSYYNGTLPWRTFNVLTAEAKWYPTNSNLSLSNAPWHLSQAVTNWNSDLWVNFYINGINWWIWVWNWSDHSAACRYNWALMYSWLYWRQECSTCSCSTWVR